jgi:hypothetical protein
MLSWRGLFFMHVIFIFDDAKILCFNPRLTRVSRSGTINESEKDSFHKKGNYLPAYQMRSRFLQKTDKDEERC